MVNVMVNLAEVWENNITDAIEENREHLDFTVMPLEEFKQECLELIKDYFDDEMIGLEINYNNFITDTAKSYDMLLEC